MSTNKTFRPGLFQVITAGAILLLLILLWRQQTNLSRLENDYRKLQSQAREALDQTAAPQQVTASTTPATAVQPPVTLKRSTNQTAAVSGAPTSHAISPEKNFLIFNGTDVTQTTNGLVATMHFKAGKTGPLGLVVMSVRIPSNIDTTIQTLKPVGAATYADSEWSVSENGRFAMFQGTLGDEKDVAIALGLSGSAHAYIKGSCGIPPLELDVQPTSAIATPFGR